jgi:YggT family protein
MQTVFFIISGVLICYSIILFLRILLTWFSGVHYGAAFDFLARITDPYIHLFRGLKFLHKGSLDFTPLAAIIVLQIFSSFFGFLAARTFLTLPSVIAALALSIWLVFIGLLGFFFILSLIRFISILAKRGSGSPIFQTIDLIIHPLIFLVMRIVPNGRKMDYHILILINMIIIFALWLFGFLLIEPNLRTLILFY